MIVYSEEIHVEGKEIICVHLKLELSLHNYSDFTALFFLQEH